MKKHIQILLIISTCLMLMSCDSKNTYVEMEKINQISISNGDDFKKPVEEFHIEIKDEEILNKVKPFINSAKKYYKKDNSNTVYADYVVEFNYNDNLTNRLFFFFPEDNKAEAFFYNIGSEDNIFSIPKEYTDELVKLFFSYGKLEDVETVIFSREDSYKKDDLDSYISIDDNDKIYSLTSILEKGVLSYNPVKKDYINYVIDLEYKNKDHRTNPFVLSIPDNKEPISFYNIGYEDMIYTIDEDLSALIRDILFER